MNKSWSPPELDETVKMTGGLLKQARLAWRLLRDSRLPGWVKLIPVAGLIYLISPIDLIPDLMLPGVGEIDDLAVLLIALKMFIELSPPGLVREHLQSLSRKKGRAQTTRQGDIIDAPYSVHDTTKE
jgi:uncharacterized membrane protein YkvA (DUF1232 family)